MLTGEMTRKLYPLELDILNTILETSGTSINGGTKAFIVWEDNYGIQMGPVRWAYSNNIHTKEGTSNSWSASPFPGAWVMVPLSQIRRVRHVDAMQ